MDYIIKDSSIYDDSDASSLLYEKDCAIRIGTIRSEVYLEDFRETRYTVEVWDSGRLMPITCIRTSRFGGIYNYEEYTNRGFTAGESTASTVRELQPGDQVIVAFLNGDSREGVILSFIPHAGRQEVIDHKKAEPNPNAPEFINREGPTSVRYASEFNGVERLINAKGEYRVTFKGQPTNIDLLLDAPDGSDIPLPEYNKDVGFSYYEFDDTGSYTLTDNASDELPQYIKVDKPGGKIEIVSGDTSFVIDKNEESYLITNKEVTFDTTDEWSLNTKVTNIDSSSEVNIESGEINTDGEWTQKGNMDIKGNVDQSGNMDISGSLSTTGETSLAGGANPLIYDIVLTIGTGNLGAPVISSHTFLKTVQTKAT